MSYRQTLNGFARIAHLKPCQIPDYHLMVGTAEQLDGMPVMVMEKAYDKDVAAMIGSTATLSNDKVAEAIESGALEVNDFMGNTALIGGGLEML